MTEQEKIEMLLSPRYMVIARWPSGCPYKKGDILIQCADHLSKFIRPGDDEATTNVFQPDSYPANLKKLEWWEERKPEDMPEYVRPVEQNEISKLQFGNYVLKVAEKHKNYFRAENLFQLAHQSWHHFLPATEAEYIQYTKPQP